MKLTAAGSKMSGLLVAVGAADRVGAADGLGDAGGAGLPQAASVSATITMATPVHLVRRRMTTPGDSSDVLISETNVGVPWLGRVSRRRAGGTRRAAADCGGDGTRWAAFSRAKVWVQKRP